MDDFKILLQSALDKAKSKTNINADIKDLQNQVSKIKIKAELDSKDLKNLMKQIQTATNQRSASVGSSKSAGAAIGKQIFNTKDLDDQGKIYFQKVNNTIKKMSSQIETKFKGLGFKDIDVSGIEKANGKIKEFTVTAKTAEGVIKKFKFDREFLVKDGKTQGGFVQADDVRVIDKTAAALAKLAKEKEKLTQKSNAIISDINIGTYDTQLLSQEIALKKLGLSSDETSDKMRNVSAAFNDLKKAATGSTIIPDDVLTKAEKLETEMAKLSNTVKQVRLKDVLVADDTKVSQTVVQLNDQLLKNTAYSKEAKAQIHAWIAELGNGNVAESRLKEINIQAKQLHSNMASIGKIGFSPIDKLTKAWEKFGGWSIATGALMKSLYMLKQGASQVKELDTELIDLAKTTDATAQELEDFYYDSNSTAKALGVTTKEIISQTSEWSRLGYAIKDAQTMAENSAILEAISPDLNIQESTDGLVSTLKAFRLEADDSLDGIISKINVIGNTQAVSNGDLVDILTRSSSAMAAANNTLDQTIALGTAATEITRNASEVGTALKTISMRIRGYDEETQEYIGNIEQLDGTIANLTKTASTPGGISLFTDDTKETFKSTYEIISDIRDIWGELTDKNQAELLEALAGKRQGQIVSAMISNFDAAEKSMTSMAHSAGNAMEEMNIIYDSLDYKLNRLSQTGVSIAQNLFQRDAMKGAIDIATTFAEALDSLTDKIGLVGTIGATSGIALFIRNLDCQKVLKIA